LADKTMLHQVFLNIINNAVKYSSHKDQPKVEIEGTEDGQTIIYSISDNGIGIPEEENIRCLKSSTGWIMPRSSKEME
jgi:signal transduction histidine kinase